jgi:hypothetical protein
MAAHYTASPWRRLRDQPSIATVEATFANGQHDTGPDDRRLAGAARTD